ncbi:MAG TPA: hypothetical protein VH092_37895, partial [Urbifossiella sp.]|nr:hypothetical protein [Urbifossiella sp.]
ARERAEAAARDHLRGAEAAETRAAGRDFAHPVARGEAEKDWKAAAELAKAADDAIRGREVDPDLGERIRTATRKVEKGYADFRADRALVDALEVARAHKVYYQDQDGEVGYSGEYFYSRFGKRAFGDAFKAAGLDPEARPDALVEYAGTRGRILGPVVAALDQWYLLDRTPERRWLLRLADRLDTDRHRKNVRAAVGEGWHGVNAVVVDIPRADLSPEAALLAAAGLEDWSRQDGAQAGGERSGPPRRKRGIDEAIKVLARVAPTVRGWDAYWVRLTLGFYLWNASGDQDDWQGGTAEAVEHLAEAERLLADPDATAAADPSTVGVLRAAAGGLRGYIVARRSTVQEVRGRLDEALRKYPGYSPLWQLAVLVRLDRGDRDAALKLAQEWARRGQSDVARGYIHLVESFADASPLEAQTALDGLSRQTASIFVQCQIKDLRAATTRWAPPDRAAPIPPALHPTRPGRELVLVLDARRRFDRVLSPVPVGLPGTGVVLRRWWAESDEAAGGGLG